MFCICIHLGQLVIEFKLILLIAQQTSELEVRF